MMYQFVHIPKTGGVSVVHYVFRHPAITGNAHSGAGHETVCRVGSNCFTVVRDPISRVLSSYRFWKYGSSTHKPKGSGTIRDFVASGSVYARPQIHWIPRDTWSDVLVVRYHPSDLGESFKKLFGYLNQKEPRNIFETANVSNGVYDILDADDLAWLREYYRDDFELWDSVCSKPELFKHVF